MRRNPTLPSPRAGDVVACPACGRTAVHARVLPLSDCCGRRVRVTHSPRVTRSLVTRVLDRVFSPPRARGWGT